MTEAQLLKLNGIRNRDFIFEGQQLLVTATPPSVLASTGGPNARDRVQTFEGGNGRSGREHGRAKHQ